MFGGWRQGKRMHNNAPSMAPVELHKVTPSTKLTVLVGQANFWKHATDCVFPYCVCLSINTSCIQGPSPYHELFTHIDYPTANLPNGTRSVVNDLPTFQQHFKHVTGGLFEGLDWSNTIVAGDVRAAMQPID
jgi:hypothetical protein